MFFSPDNENIAYMGRIDFSVPEEPKFYYAGSQIIFGFRGTSLKIKLGGAVYWGELFLGVILDGEMLALPLSPENNGRDVILTAAEGLPDTEHSVIIYKRSAANHFMIFKGIETDGALTARPVLPDYKIEVYGDSVCAGEVIEAEEYAAKPDPENHNSRYDNVWNSFVMQTAHDLGAQIHNIAQGGIALFDNTGYFHYPDYIGLESVYDKLCYFPEAGELTGWDFSLYTPDLVIIAIGQNDKHNGKTEKDDLDISEPSYREVWKTAYKQLVRTLDGKYGSPCFVLTTTVLCHDEEWDKAIGEITDELRELGVNAHHNLFSRNGTATPGHPRLSEHNEMARELTAFISKLRESE